MFLIEGNDKAIIYSGDIRGAPFASILFQRLTHNSGKMVG